LRVRKKKHKSELSSLDFTVNRFFSQTLQNRQHRGRQKLSSLLWS